MQELVPEGIDTTAAKDADNLKLLHGDYTSATDSRTALWAHRCATAWQPGQCMFCSVNPARALDNILKLFRLQFLQLLVQPTAV